jgi:hypothetical protein
MLAEKITSKPRIIPNNGLEITKFLSKKIDIKNEKVMANPPIRGMKNLCKCLFPILPFKIFVFLNKNKIARQLAREIRSENKNGNK